MTDSNLDHLHPVLRPLAKKWLDLYQATGRRAEISITYRSKAEQDTLYAKGRTVPGKIVTNAPGGHSKHEFTFPDGTPAAKAFDFRLYDEENVYISDGTDDWYTDAGAIGKSLGLIWGGDWHHPDYDHLELM